LQGANGTPNKQKKKKGADNWTMRGNVQPRFAVPPAVTWLSRPFLRYNGLD
jgi:hypothetical protein